jgi:hypothetical protein
MHHCKFLVYEDMCFQRSDLWGRDFGLADPSEKPLLLINKKAYLDEKFATKFIFNPILICYNKKLKRDKAKVFDLYKFRIIDLLITTEFNIK